MQISDEAFEIVLCKWVIVFFKYLVFYLVQMDFSLFAELLKVGIFFL